MSLQSKLRPPHYAADKPGIYITRTDDALDKVRLERELAEIKAAKLAETPDASETELADAAAGHPLNRYWAGEHRFDLDAVDYFRGQPVKIRDYFNQAEPAAFTLRRLSVEELYSLDVQQVFAQRMALACRLGVESCSAVKLTKNSGKLDDASMRALYDADPTLPLALGLAVVDYNRPISESEGKR